MNKRLRKWIIGIGVVAVIVVIYRFAAQEKPIQVTVRKVEKGTVETLVANTRAGTVKACRRAHLAPTIGGQIAILNVKEGDYVDAGQILMELWNDDLSAQLELAVNEAKAARSQAEQVCLLAENADREATRQVNLRKQGITSEEQVDKAVTNAKAQKAACQGARIGASVSQSRVSVSQAALERTILLAPFSGRVAEVNGELGEYSTPSPPGIPTLPAVDLMDLSCLYIAAPFDEVDVPNVRVGMIARISLDAFAAKSFKGTVQRVAPYVLELEKQARTVDVEAVFDNPQGSDSLIPGYSADLEVILDKKENVLRFPTEALMEGNRVFVLASNVLQERVIKPGLSNWVWTEAQEGLQEGETVVTSVGREGIKAGIAAEVEKTTKQGAAP